MFKPRRTGTICPQTIGELAATITTIRRIGNSTGVILPRPALLALRVETGDALSVTVEDGRVVLTPAPAHPRAKWAEAARELAAAGDDSLVWPEFGTRTTIS